MKFDYQYLEGKFLPLVPIKLRKENEWLVLRGFVDTGASFCLFHADILELLGKNLEDGEKREMVVGDGGVCRAVIVIVRPVSSVLPLPLC